MNTQQQKVPTQTRFPVRNLVYDLCTLIHVRGQGLEALDKYEQDARQGGHDAFVQLIQKMRQQDQEVLTELDKILARNVK